MYTIDSLELEEKNAPEVDTKESIAFYPPAFKKKSKKNLYLVVILVLTIFIVGIIIFKQQKAAPIPTATFTPTPTPESTPIPDPLIREEWFFEVLNGSGVSGLAKKLADKLIALGYQVYKTGNADKQSYEVTQIQVRKDLLEKVNLVVADLKDAVKIASMAGELKEGTASARIIIGKDLSL